MDTHRVDEREPDLIAAFGNSRRFQLAPGRREPLFLTCRRRKLERLLKFKWVAFYQRRSCSAPLIGHGTLFPRGPALLLRNPELDRGCLPSRSHSLMQAPDRIPHPVKGMRAEEPVNLPTQTDGEPK